ncbi:hypothetical protein [Xanthomonas translucens]|uniref:Uncharacterized protein n=1 Tax=Xanthomonas translucens pv. translucens TaxID=134875 RepID=A0ABW9KZQ8_XANCT|nr:hypothetical protein [Xanthomonas translucens]
MASIIPGAPVTRAPSPARLDSNSRNGEPDKLGPRHAGRGTPC